MNLTNCLLRGDAFNAIGVERVGFQTEPMASVAMQRHSWCVRLVSAALICRCILFLPSSALASPSPIRPGTGPTQASLSGAGGSFAPSFSGDGCVIVFLSQAKNLVANSDRSPFLNVFLRNRQTGLTQLVSVNRTGLGGGDADVTYASVSADGQRVVFASAASNLVGNDTNGVSDVFLRDLSASRTALVSVDMTGTLPGDGFSTAPVLSADGRWVAFESDASNLVTNDLNGVPGAIGSNRDVFLRDLRSNTTTLVSVSANGLNSGVGRSTSPARSDSPVMTPEGRFVAFRSEATNLVAGMGTVSFPSPWTGIFVRDMSAGQTVWASSNVWALLGTTTQCQTPALSADGRVLVFKAMAGTSSMVWVFRHDLQTGQTTCLSTNSRASTVPQVSADGRFVAFEDATNILVWDALIGSNTVANLNSDGSPIVPGPAHTPVLTPDGRYLAFLAQGSPMVTNAWSVPRPSYQTYLRDLQMGQTWPVSTLPDGTPSPEGCEAGVPAVTADGQWVAFESPDDSLVTGDANRASDVFLRDVAAGVTSLVSVRHPERPALTGAGMCRTWPNGLSADGRLLVFTSLDNNLVPGDTNAMQDVFLRDLVTGTNAMLTADTNWWSSPVISGNGRYVACLRLNTAGSLYYDSSNNPDPVTGTPCRYDLQTGSNGLATVWQDGSPAASSVTSATVSLSPDGRLVAFSTRCNLLGARDTFTTYENVYVRDMERGSNFMISRTVLGTDPSNPSGHSTTPVFSPDGRWLLFMSWAPDLAGQSGVTPPAFYVADLGTNSSAPDYLVTNGLRSVGGGNTLRYSDPGPLFGRAPYAVFSTNSRFVLAYPRGDQWQWQRTDLLDPDASVVFAFPTSVWPGCALSGDGRYAVAALSSASPGGLVVADLAHGTFENVSFPGPVGPHGVRGLTVSGDGSYVLFSDTYPTNRRHLVLYDRLQKAMLVLSTNQAGAGANGDSSDPMLGPDGRTVVFRSFASDLAEGAYGDYRNIFLLQLGAGDTDGDGMDDDWEMRWFGTLARDGTGDFDGDGVSDLAEFQAGTDPTSANPAQASAFLRVFTTQPAAGGPATLFWAAAPGRFYRVQYKNEATEAGWTILEGTPTVDGTTAWMTDPAGVTNSHRFYRVAVGP